MQAMEAEANARDRGERPHPALNEWHTLVVALLGALVTGFIYGYSTYSNALQAAFKDDIGQSAKETIGIAPVLCNLITFTTGLIMDRTSIWFCCILGGLIMLCSYTLYGIIALKYMTVSSPVVWFFTLGAAGNYGASFMVAATFTVLTKNFKDMRSDVISIGKSFVGVATGLGTAIFCGLVPTDDTSTDRLFFLFFAAGVTGLIPIFISPFMRPLPPAQLQLPDRFLIPLDLRLPIGYFLSAVLIITTLASTFAKNSMAFSFVLIVLLILPFILIIPRCGGARTVGAMVTPLNISPVQHQPLSIRSSRSISFGTSPWECGPLEMVNRLEFVLLWCCTLLLQAGGLFLTTNIGSMVQSRSGPAVSSATAITIFSCTQGFARLVTGKVTNRLLLSGLPRTTYFPILLAVMSAGHFVLSLSGSLAMCFGTALCGWAFGSVYPLLVLAVAELFGSSRVASNYMIFDGTPGAVGALVFAKFLVQSVFNAHEDADGKCHGDECFWLSHVVMVIACLVGFLMGCVLFFRTRGVYSKIVTIVGGAPM